jgi:hypothetical protein
MSLEYITSSISVILEKRTFLLESSLSFYSSLLRSSLYSIIILGYRSLHTASLLLTCSILIVSIASYYREASSC